MTGLSEAEQELVALVRRWVDDRVRPQVRGLEHADQYPGQLLAEMKGMGLFALALPEPYGAGVSTACFALATEELARGWMSLAGATGSHAVVGRLIARFGTPEQQECYLPRMATGEIRAAMALTEPQGGTDLQAITTRARTDATGHYLVTGTKTWITNAAHAGVFAMLCKTDPEANPPWRGISVLLGEPGAGLDVSTKLGKLGYRGVETCEVHIDGWRLPPGSVLGGAPGQGFPQMMAGLELGRVQVASRAVGVARAAFEDALAYAQQRETFGEPIWRHQSVGNLLADMATQLDAARLLVLRACDRIDSGERADLEAGMAKLFASEACLRISMDAMRVHGALGYSTELDIERYYRDAPLMAIGEGTNEIQRSVIARQLVARAEQARGRGRSG